MSDKAEHIPCAVAAAYGIEIRDAELVTSGLINRTWIVGTGVDRRVVVQRLHRVFQPAVNDRIRYITAHLASRDVRTPQIIETLSGDSCLMLEDEIWRVLSYVEGHSIDVVSETRYARSAGQQLARFHAAFVDFADADRLPVSEVHQPWRHFGVLRDALDKHRSHASYARVAALADAILASAEELPDVPEARCRVVHGDPKISNILFDAGAAAVCMVDLDTVGLMPLALELGDAFRSWCNPCGEDTADTLFSIELFREALTGYAEIADTFLTGNEIRGIVPAVQTIYTELAARFCADALQETYFAWNSAKFSSRSEHNLVRAYGQFNAAKDFFSNREAALRVVADVLPLDR